MFYWLENSHFICKESVGIGKGLISYIRQISILSKLVGSVSSLAGNSEIVVELYYIHGEIQRPGGCRFISCSIPIIIMITFYDLAAQSSIPTWSPNPWKTR